MGRTARLLGLEAPRAVARARSGVQFHAVAPPHEVSGHDPAGGTTLSLTRAQALEVPAVLRGRNMICSTLASLPLQQFTSKAEPRTASWLQQPNPKQARVVTLALTYDDLLFYGKAFWYITEKDNRGFPAKVEHVRDTDGGRLRFDADGKIFVDGKRVTDADIIRFDSPNPGILGVGRSVVTARRLDTMTEVYADGGQPLGYFTPADPAQDPFEDEDPEDPEYDANAGTVGGVISFLTSWTSARKKRAIAYVPGALKYVPVQFNPEQLQLHQARQHAVLEISRLLGIDPEDLGVSTTSRTYANQFDRRKAFVDFTLAAYIHAVEERLSMPDVTPRGDYVRVNLDGFLRSSTAERYAAHEIGLRAGFLTVDEVRSWEDMPPLPGGAGVTPAAPEAEAPPAE